MINMIDNFLTMNDLKELENLCNDKGFSYGWKSNINIESYHWNITFGGPKNYKDETAKSLTQEDLPEFIWKIWTRINNQSNRKLIRAYVNGYTYGTEGSIHIDSTITGNKTHMIYINTEWKPHWAGETIFLVNDEIFRSILPKPGRLVEFSGSIPHCARSVSRLSGILRKVLVLKSLPCN